LCEVEHVINSNCLVFCSCSVQARCQSAGLEASTGLAENLRKYFFNSPVTMLLHEASLLVASLSAGGATTTDVVQLPLASALVVMVYTRGAVLLRGRVADVAMLHGYTVDAPLVMPAPQVAAETGKKGGAGCDLVTGGRILAILVRLSRATECICTAVLTGVTAVG
jgi:hypothetical protein